MAAIAAGGAFAQDTQIEEIVVTGSRISRPDFETLHYEVTIDDPKAYTRPWTASWDIPWADEQMLEYFCQDNNLDLQHLAGPDAR